MYVPATTSTKTSNNDDGDYRLGRAFASVAGGRQFDPRPGHTKYF